MQQFRVIEIPKTKVAFSGPIRTKEAFEKFNQWFTAYHASLKCQLFPRDFMWFNEKENATEWAYALPDNYKVEDCGGFEIKEITFGLYAVSVCLDADLDQAQDWMKTRGEIKEWVNNSKLFRLHVNGMDEGDRYDMFQIVTPGFLQEQKFSFEDMFVPIHLK